MELGDYGVTFNDWVSAYHKYGTEWMEDQLTTLEIAVENSKQLDIHYSTPQTNTQWDWKA